MSLPSAYLTSTTRVPQILASIRGAKAPQRFSQKFLVNLGFQAASDRLLIGVLKALGFLNDAGEPRQRYFEYLDETQSRAVMAMAIREAYADLFEIDLHAERMSASDLKNKLRTLTQGQFSDSILDKMALTFRALVAQADFEAEPRQQSAHEDELMDDDAEEDLVESDVGRVSRRSSVRSQRQVELGGLVYNVEIHLPESRDPVVYEVLFRSLKEHLLS